MKCLECGTININLRTTCHKCGASLELAKALEDRMYKLEVNFSDLLLIKGAIRYAIASQYTEKQAKGRLSLVLKKIEKLKEYK